MSDDTARRVEDFMKAVGYVPECEEDPAGVAWLNRPAERKASSSVSGARRGLGAAKATAIEKPKVVFENINVMQKWLSTGNTDFLEIFCGWQQLTYRVREVGLQAADGIDLRVVSHGRAWALGNPVADAELAWLICHGLRPRATHAGTPCKDMSVLGTQSPTGENEANVALTLEIMDHQENWGFLASHENPKRSLLFEREDWNKLVGSVEKPVPPWTHQGLCGCLAKVKYPGEDRKNEPMRKEQYWTANFDIRAMGMNCEKPKTAMFPTDHEHVHVRGSAKTSDGSWISVATFSGTYTGVQATLYAQCLRKGLKEVRTKGGIGPSTKLSERASRLKEIRTKFNAEATKSSAGVIGALVVAPSVPEPLRVMTIYKNETLDLDSGIKGRIPESNVPHVQEHVPAQESLDAQRRREEHLDKASETARGYWIAKAKKGEFDSVLADLEVYKYSDRKVTADPRRSEEYKSQVVVELKFGDDADTKEPHRRLLSKADKELCVDVFTRKAAAFHLEGTPRTTVRKVLHDCIPTGPPTRTPPHNLKGTDAQWTADQLEEQVKTGQLVRGNSPWGSPPFPTKDFPGHKKARKRRLVVDYRRVNLRTLRAIYYVRRASDILVEAMGSVWYSLLDAVAGFNQIVNTQRAREMLAIVAHTGTFLPRCLTFGPHNGPEDFAFVTDHVFSLGKRAEAAIL
jgi:hypothetical protein